MSVGVGVHTSSGDRIEFPLLTLLVDRRCGTVRYGALLDCNHHRRTLQYVLFLCLAKLSSFSSSFLSLSPSLQPQLYFFLLRVLFVLRLGRR